MGLSHRIFTSEIVSALTRNIRHELRYPASLLPHQESADLATADQIADRDHHAPVLLGLKVEGDHKAGSCQRPTLAQNDLWIPPTQASSLLEKEG